MLHRIEAYLRQNLGIRGKFFGAGRKAIGAEQKRENIGVLFPGQAARLIGWHGRLDLFEQVAGGLSVPIALEVRAGERRRGAPSVQIGAMARRALLLIQRFAPVRLSRSVDSVPDRHRLLCLQSYRKQKDVVDCVSHTGTILDSLCSR
jgi:hypothetical protein